ncbi:MAG: N-acetyltransferase [bacterium]
MIRKARIRDAHVIRNLINEYAHRGLLLPLSLSEIYDRIRDFFVYQEETGDGALAILGICALHIIWEDLAEIRSLAVTENHWKQGIGSRLVQACLKEATDLEVKKIFCLTYKREFFSSQGFTEIDKSQLPHKIWSDCLKCSKFPECEEIAMMYEIPRR